MTYEFTYFRHIPETLFAPFRILAETAFLKPRNILPGSDLIRNEPLPGEAPLLQASPYLASRQCCHVPYGKRPLLMAVAGGETRLM